MLRLKRIKTYTPPVSHLYDADSSGENRGFSHPLSLDLMAPRRISMTTEEKGLVSQLVDNIFTSESMSDRIELLVFSHHIQGWHARVMYTMLQLKFSGVTIVEINALAWIGSLCCASSQIVL
ncbi:hypothetical protein ElyMa_004331100 [Elysia marginata]|uniref:Uncharacterized protein n=1 Tax=Elysia marginata TaxID=1093978 RepID=A0AAV4H2K0_9GAST|nr:hypothetical protein ElyMa_004331100 [Elysia marginata]